MRGVLKFFVFSALVFAVPAILFAKLGVGVGTGKIHVDQLLKPGLVYPLPVLIVLNTGDEPSDYGVGVDYVTGQEKNPSMGMRPAREWFNFEPSSFYLKPGQTKQVQIHLSLPVSGVQPGTYYAYLSAHPIRKSVPGQTAVGIAAAAQIWFTVAPANFFQGVYYRFISLYVLYHPWDTIVLAMIFVAALLWFISKKFKFQIARK